MLHDVAGAEQDPLSDLAPGRRPSHQGLEIHAEMLVLLAYGVAHDGERLGIFLHGDPLLVPANRLGLLGQRRTETGKGPRLRWKLFGRFVVLVNAHPISSLSLRS